MKKKEEAKSIALDVDREILGEALHTALRKACDSTPTTLLWNVITLIDNEVWILYLDHVWEELRVGGKMASAVKSDADDKWYVATLKEASLGFYNAVNERYRSHSGRLKISWNWVNVLTSVFELMTDGDWQGYAAYLVEN